MKIIITYLFSAVLSLTLTTWATWASSEESLQISAWTATGLSLFVGAIGWLVAAIAALGHHLSFDGSALWAADHLLGHWSPGLAVKSTASYEWSTATSKSTAWGHNLTFWSGAIRDDTFTWWAPRTEAATTGAEATATTASVEAATIGGEWGALHVGAIGAGHIGCFVALYKEAKRKMD